MKSNETAAIFIEFQNDFCTSGGKLYSLVSDEITRNNTIANAVRLIEGLRMKGIMIIHCPFTLDRNWVEKHQVQGTIKDIYDYGIFEPGSWGHSIIKEMTPREDEIVLEGKRTLSAFSHTNLHSLLQFRGIKNLIVCGFLTNVCAKITATSAYDLGYCVRMVPAACGAATQPLQKYIEEDYSPIIGGSVGIDEILKMIN